MRYFPAFLDLQSAPTLIVGGGEIAARKLVLLSQAGASVTVVSPRASAGISGRAKEGGLRWLARRFEPADVAGMRIVIAATGDRDVNTAVARAAREAGIPVNVVDDAALSTFIVPAIVERSPLVIAISSGGVAPMLATRVRDLIENLLDESWGRLALFAERWRARIRAGIADLAARRRFYDWLLDGPAAALVRAGREGEADRILGERMTAVSPPTGSVTLVGAGPGDPELLTLRALHALQAADVILVDRLVSPQVLTRARRDAEVIDVGKTPGGHGARQERINRMLVAEARRGRRVVRLKGGDPFVFGRGGEELEYLQRHGIAFEVVPGVTAALACAAYAGIPLTHRDHAQGLQFVTAHCRESIDAIDWTGLARAGQTLAFYMGIAELDAIRDRLTTAGLSPATPVALVENGTCENQRVVVTELADLPGAAHRHSVGSPSMLFVGDVAAFATKLHWFGAAPVVESSPQVSTPASRAA
ncbi:MAG: uroporphyrinogen-III C-methyltransferase [Gammaproteobacteria bacterium]|nr:uroporphyrinogen-III C-methyltransferase [Gammaproteobacteria bacterium]